MLLQYLAWTAWFRSLSELAIQSDWANTSWANSSVVLNVICSRLKFQRSFLQVSKSIYHIFQRLLSHIGDLNLIQLCLSYVGGPLSVVSLAHSYVLIPQAVLGKQCRNAREEAATEIMKKRITRALRATTIVVLRWGSTSSVRFNITGHSIRRLVERFFMRVWRAGLVVQTPTGPYLISSRSWQSQYVYSHLCRVLINRRVDRVALKDRILWKN